MCYSIPKIQIHPTKQGWGVPPWETGGPGFTNPHQQYLLLPLLLRDSGHSSFQSTQVCSSNTESHFHPLHTSSHTTSSTRRSVGRRICLPRRCAEPLTGRRLQQRRRAIIFMFCLFHRAVWRWTASTPMPRMLDGYQEFKMHSSYQIWSTKASQLCRSSPCQCVFPAGLKAFFFPWQTAGQLNWSWSLSIHFLFMWYHYQMITVESCAKEVSGVKTDKRIQATQPNSVFVSLEESFQPKFAHQRPQKTTIQGLFGMRDFFPIPAFFLWNWTDSCEIPARFLWNSCVFSVKLNWFL